MAKNENNLDLSDVDSQDWDKLASKIEDFYKSDTPTKNQLAYNWDRNHLMLDGRQWIVFDGDKASGGQWRQIKVSKQNEFIPKPVTNYLFSAYQTLKSYLIKDKPRSSVTPNTQTYRDKSSAKIAGLCIDANYERLKEQYNYEYAASNLITYGTVFKKDWWNSTAGQLAKVPQMTQRPKTDPMTGAVMGMEEVPVIDEFGDVVYDEIQLGDVDTDIVEPYRITIDPLATDLHKAKWIMEASIQTLDWVQDMYGKDPEQFPGYTGQAQTLEEGEKDMPATLRRFYQLKNSSGVNKGLLATAGDGVSGEKMPEHSVVLKEYYERPSSKYPKGRLVVVANEKTLYAGDSPYEGPDVGDWHPYSDCRWELVPGRFWGKSPLDAAVEVQKQVNSIDAVIALTRKTMAIPQKLIPTGSGIEPGSWTGRPGQEVFYRADGINKPETIMPIGVDAQVWQERAQKVDDIKELTGATDILKGQQPEGVTAASALNMLYEVGTGKIFPILDRWKAFIESSQKKQLRLVAKMYKEPRPEFIAMLKAKNTELSEEAISHFIGQDLYENCNVIIEAGSNIPKLQAAKEARLMEAAQTGALNLELPANRIEFQRQLGISGFDSDVGPDTHRAEWENDLLDNIQNSPANQPVVLDCDQHPIHISVHTNRMKEPSFMSLPMQVQQAYQAHVQKHEQMQQMQQQAQMLQMQAAGLAQIAAGHKPGAPGGKAPGQPGQAAPMGGDKGHPGRPHHNGAPAGPGTHSASTGPTKDVKNALNTDVLAPALPGAAGPQPR